MKSASQLKQDVALHLLPHIRDRSILLLGSGTTVTEIIQQLDVANIKCVSSSTATSLALQKHDLSEVQLDQVKDDNRLCIDGADLVLRESGNIIKGHGGALVREKITWQHATEIIVAIDESKLANKITVKVPIAVIPFGLTTTLERVLHLSPVEQVEIHYRGGLPYRTDDNLMILHAKVAQTCDLGRLDQRLHQIVGVVETGIFLRDDYQSVRFVCGTQEGIVEF